MKISPISYTRSYQRPNNNVRNNNLNNNIKNNNNNKISFGTFRTPAAETRAYHIMHDEIAQGKCYMPDEVCYGWVDELKDSPKVSVVIKPDASLELSYTKEVLYNPKLKALINYEDNYGVIKLKTAEDFRHASDILYMFYRVEHGLSPDDDPPKNPNDEEEYRDRHAERIAETISYLAQ